MNVLSPTDFFAQTMGGRPNMMDMSIYQGHYFECACGQEHVFAQCVEVLRELPGHRLVFACPEDPNTLTCIRLKGFFRFKGFVSLFGARFDESIDIMSTFRSAFEKEFGVDLGDK